VSAGNGKMPSARVILAVRRDVEISRNKEEYNNSSRPHFEVEVGRKYRLK